MFSPKSYAFIDESGDPSLELEKDGVSTHFVVAAALIKEENLVSAREQAEIIRRRHFQSGEIKSSGIGPNDTRRLAILKDIQAIPGTFYVFVVDKRVIWKDSGLIFKKPFLKFLTGKVYSRIFRTFSHLEVTADEHGTKSFMEQFQSYIKNNHQQSLFELSTFKFSPSISEPLIQIADLVAGSVRRAFDTKRPSTKSQEILQSLRGKMVVLEEWPPLYHSLSEILSEVVSDDNDSLVREYCKNQVGIYLRDLASNEEHSEIREAALSFLADQSRYSETDRYTSSGELISHLFEMGFTEITPHFLRSQIIAHYRDNGVIIASNNTGYKIPTETKDILNYVERCSSVIGPMLHRLRQARAQILLRSHGNLDIVAPLAFEELKNILEAQ